MFGLLTISKIVNETGKKMTGKVFKYSNTWTEVVLSVKGTKIGISAPYSLKHSVGVYLPGFIWSKEFKKEIPVGKKEFYLSAVVYNEGGSDFFRPVHRRLTKAGCASYKGCERYSHLFLSLLNLFYLKNTCQAETGIPV